VRIERARRRTRLATLVTAAGLVAGGLLTATAAPSEALLGPLTFEGAGLGAIEDGPGYCAQAGELDVKFDVSGLDAPPTKVAVDGLAIQHDYLGDLVVTLFAPTGRAPCCSVAPERRANRKPLSAP